MEREYNSSNVLSLNFKKRTRKFQSSELGPDNHDCSRSFQRLLGINFCKLAYVGSHKDFLYLFHYFTSLPIKSILVRFCA